MARLDQTDRAILYELDRDARSPLSRIAKKVHLSREAVLYRLRGYLRQGTLRGFLSVIDMGQFGFSHHKVFVRLHNIGKEKETQLISSLCANPHVTWVASCDGNYSLVFALKARSPKQLSDILQEINKNYWQCFMLQDISSIVEAHHYHRDYLIGKQGTTEREIQWISSGVSEKIDEKNLLILEQLSKNPRATSVEIAKVAGFSPDSVLNRIKQMEVGGVISHYTIWPNATQLNGAYYKVLLTLRSLDAKNERALLAYFRQHPNIVYVVSTIGQWQFEMDVEIESTEAFRELMRKFLEKFHDVISDYSALNVYNEYKYRFFDKTALENNDGLSV